MRAEHAGVGCWHAVSGLSLLAWRVGSVAQPHVVRVWRKSRERPDPGTWAGGSVPSLVLTGAEGRASSFLEEIFEDPFRWDQRVWITVVR